MSYEFVEVEKDGHLWIVTLNRPEVMNALHPPAHKELDIIFDDFTHDADAWVAIVTGKGDRAFSAGNDLKYHAEHGSAAIRAGMVGVHSGFGGLTKRARLNKPLIAAVNGFALGGGFEIVLACDLVVAAEGATFGLPEPRVGLMAAAGGVHRLPRHVPFHVAMGMLLTGRRVSAAEALGMGLVNEVVPPAELLDCARRWAAQILECAPLSIRASKEAVLRGLDMPLQQALDTALPGQLALGASEDYIEGPRAFAEKRPPVWKGR